MAESPHFRPSGVREPPRWVGQVRRAECGAVSLLSSSPPHLCTSAPLHRCTAAPLHRCTPAPRHLGTSAGSAPSRHCACSPPRCVRTRACSDRALMRRSLSSRGWPVRLRAAMRHGRRRGRCEACRAMRRAQLLLRHSPPPPPPPALPPPPLPPPPLPPPPPPPLPTRLRARRSRHSRQRYLRPIGNVHLRL